MHQLQRAGMPLLEVDARDTAIIYLAEELTEVGAALVPNPCTGEQARLVASLHNTVGEVDVLAEAHLREAAQLQIHIAADAHVERTRIELVQFLLPSANAAGGEETRHRVGDGFLHIGERRMGSIRTAEGICRLASQFIVDGLQVTRGQHHIAVEHQQIVALSPLGTVVAALAGSAVGLHEVLDVQPVGISPDHLFAVLL